MEKYGKIKRNYKITQGNTLAGTETKEKTAKIHREIMGKTGDKYKKVQFCLWRFKVKS